MRFRIVILTLLSSFVYLNRAFPQCSVVITPNPATVCSGSSVTLTATTTGTAPITYSWSSGGTGNTTSVSPTVQTTYSVNITDGLGCIASASVIVNVNPSPAASFTFTNNNACGGTNINFTSTVSGGQAPYTYSWNFGGAGTSAQPNPSFSFNPAAGNGTQGYNVILTVTDSRGCTATVSQSVTVKKKPDASIADEDIFTPWVFCDSSGGLQLLIDNTSTTQASNTNYNINWGDGSSAYNAATLPNGTSHTYSGQGFFNLVLTVTGGNGCTATTTYNIFSGGNPEIGLANPGGTVNICASKQITFPITNYSNNPPGTIYTVTVNDGSTPVVFTHPPPASYTHNFDISSCGFTSLGGFANAFDVRIVAENPCGTTAALVEPIRLGSPPVADFTFTPPPDICVGSTVDFTSTAQGTFNNNGVCSNLLSGGWSITPATGWTLVSGSLTSPNPMSINFSQKGLYNVRLIVSNPCGSDTTIRPLCVAEPPDANFTTPSLSGCAPLTLPTTNTSNTIGTCANTIYAWAVTHNGSLCSSGGNWHFQSGTATSQSPTIQFTGSGTYTVSLTITNNCGVSTKIKTVTVDKIPELAIAPIPNICAGNTISPTALINNCYSTLSNVNWSFPGGSPASSTSQNPGSITYNTDGTYTVTLSATNACGTGTDNETFTIAPKPPTPVLSSNSPKCTGQTITINASSINGVTYTWTGPLGFTSNQQNITLNNATTLQSGTYTLVVTDALGCTNTASINIVINPLPVVTVNSPPPLCTGGSVQLTAGGASSYTWSPAAGLSATTGATVSAHPNSTTTYTVTGTDGNGCSKSAAALVTINPLPNISVTQPPAICVGQSTVLIASGGVSYNWSPATGLSGTTGATVTANPNSTTTYTVTGTDANGCTGSATTTVTVNTLPNVTVNTPPAICAGQSATLIANGANSYTWSPATGLSATTGTTVSANPNSTTTYTVTGTSGGCSNTAQTTVTVYPLPVVIVNSGTICAGSSIVLNAGGATSYTWSPATGLSGTTGASVTATPPNSITYTVTGTDGNNCSNTANAMVTITPNPTVDAGPDQTLCNQNIPVQLTGTPNGGTWSGTGVTPGGSFNPATAGVGAHTLTYDYSNGTGCAGSDAVIITVVAPTFPNARNNFSVCRDAPAIDLNLHNNPTPSGGTWSGIGVLFGTFTPALALNGPNTITYTVGTGTCQTSDDIIITVNPQPTITVNSPSVCAGNSVILNAGGGATYGWSPATGLSATNGASVTATPSGNMTYTITGTDGNGCTNTTTSTVTVNPLPVVDAGPDQTLCEQNTTIQLTGTPNNGTWSGSGITAGGSFNPSIAGVGTHQITYSSTDGNGCSNSDITQISVVTLTVPVAGNDITLCRDAAIVDLNSQNNPTPPGGSWSGTGVSGTTFNPANGVIGQNVITYSVGTGTCLASDVITITVNALPVVTVNSPPICAGGSITLTANGASSYNWSPVSGLSGTTGTSVTANPTNTTVYTVTGTDGNNCINIAASTVTVNPLPIVDAGPDQTFCDQNIPVQLNGTPVNGNWTGTGVTTGGSFNPSTAGVGAHQLTYSFTDNNSCSNNDVVTMTVIVPTIANAGNDFPLCVDASPVDLNLQNNPTPVGGTWTGAGVANNIFTAANAAIGQNPLVYSIGTGTCLSMDTAMVTVNALPVVSVNSPTICESGSATLMASGAATYSWTPTTTLSDSIGATVTASPIVTTVYTVRGTDANACVNSTNATVSVNPLPIVDAGPDQTFCDQNIPVQLNGTPANGSWTGTGVTTTGSFNPSTAGIGSHQLTYSFTDNNSCSNNDVVTMTVIVPTIANAGNDFPLCVDASPVDLNVQNNPTPVGGTWTGAGVANNIFTAANAVIGQNQLVYSIGTGTCLSMDTARVTVNALPVVSVNSPTICESGSATLMASGAATYSWTPTATLSDSIGATVTASPIVTTVYTVRGTDANACVNSTNATVSVNPLPIVDAGPDQTFCDQNIPVQLNGTPASGSWTGIGVTTTGSFNPSIAGIGSHQLTYSFTDNNSCSNNDVVTMTVIVPTIANAGNDFPLCVDASPVDLNVQNNPTPVGGTWTGAGVANNIFTAANAAIGQNPLVYSIGTGTCLSMDTARVTVNALPVVSVNSPTICESGSATLMASGAATYSWTPTTTLSDSIGATVTASPIVTTVYTVRGTDANACVNSTNATVSVNPLPIVDAGPDQTFCDQNIPVQLNGTPANGSWTGIGVTTTGSFNPSIAGIGSHQLTYSFTDNNSCSNDDVVTMTVIVPTIANAGNDFPLCVDASPVDLNLQNNPTPVGGTWTGAGVANNIFTAANAAIGQNPLVYSIGTGTCLSMDTAMVTVNALPVVSVNSPTICESGSATLMASGAATYSWTPTATLSDSIGATVTASPIVTTVYTVRGTDANACVNSTNATVSVNPLPIVDAGPDQTFCDQNIPVQLNGTPANGSWTGTGVTTAGSFNPSIAGVGAHQLTYTFTDNSNCTNSDDVTMTVIAPALTHAGNDFPLCHNANPVDLNLQNNPTPPGGTWVGSGVVNNIFDPNAAIFGQNEIIYSIGTGTCLTRDTIKATVNPLPIVSVNSGAICENDYITLICSGADVYTWSPMSDLSIISGAVADASPMVTTVYTITGTDTNGCADTVQAIVIVHPLPVVNAGPDVTTCNQSQFPTQLNANPVGGVWSGNYVTPNGIFTPGGSPADTGSHIVTYSLTDGNGCANADNAIVIVTAPVYAVAGPDKSFCYDDPVGILTGFSPAGGIWSGAGVVDSTTGLFNPSLAGVGNSVLHYKYGGGTCATRDSVRITINPLPTPDFSFNTTCINDTTFFTDLSIANTGTINAWHWDFGNGNTSAAQNPSYVFAPVGNHTITFDVTNSAGCNSDTTFTLAVHPLPTVAFTHDSMICPDSALQIYLTTVDALNYNWDFGDGSTGTGINPTHSYSNVGVYQIKLIAETQFGCLDSATSHVRVPEPPNAFFTFNPKEGCAPLDVAFYPILPPDWTGLRYMWVFGNGDTTFNPIPPDHVIYNAASDGSDTSYVVEFYVYSATCQNFGKFVDTVKVLNTPPAIVTANFNIGCGQTNVFFTNTNNTVFDSLYVDYGDGTGEIVATSDVTFTHTFTNTTNSNTTFTVSYYARGASCNSVPGTIPVSVYPNTVKAGITAASRDVCLGERITLTSNASGASYFYYDFGTGVISPQNNTAHSITLNLTDTGTYTIYQLVYSADSCSFGKDSLKVNVHQAPIADFEFSQPSSGCDGSEVIFNNLSHGYSNSVWDFGDNTTAVADSPSHIFQQQGSYIISLFTESAAGCKDTLTKPVTIDFLEKGLYVPNAFSPEFGDPKVREFKPAGQCLESYHLHIYNTWGELLWETYALTPDGQPAEGWNGRHMKTGLLLPQDVYVWKIEAVFMNSSVWEGKDYDDGRVKKIGSVTLLR